MSAAVSFAAPRSAATGLVSVPTTCPQARSDDFALQRAVQAGHREALAKDVGAFRTDPGTNRLARLRRSVGFGARAHSVSERGHRTDVAWMVTLTYRGVDDWRPDHVTNAVNAMRKWLARMGLACRYVWVAEMQKRGAIHYHLCVWLPRGQRMPKWDTRGWWPHGMSQRVVARNAIGYLLKYLSKGTDLAFPKGARVHACGGLEHSLRRAKRWLGLPRFVQRLSSTTDKWERADGGGWTAPDGSHFASEFRQVLVGPERYIQRVLTHAGIEGFEPSGPYSWMPQH